MELKMEEVRCHQRWCTVTCLQQLYFPSPSDLISLHMFEHLPYIGCVRVHKLCIYEITQTEDA